MNTTPTPTRPNKTWLLAAVFLLLLFTGLYCAKSSLRSAVRPASAIHAAVSSADGWADESRCADCHEQAESFHETGHANSLSKASSPDSVDLLRLLRESNIGAKESAHVDLEDGVRIHTSIDDVQYSTEANWCVGSGTHARTWVSTQPGTMGDTDLLEIRWTWFRSLDSFDVTPGQPDGQSPGAVGCMGLLFDGPRAWRCFACHSTRVPTTHGGIDEANIVPGINCQRCHGPRQKHVETEGDYHDPAWIDLTREEKFNRCAECHRHPSEQAPEDIRPDNPDIVRFQPVGLSQSACFKSSQMTCTTCHDPHTPMHSQDLAGTWQCIQCHDPKHSDHTLCSAGMTDNCLSCHMPKVKTGIPVAFTDHWIRVREGGEASP